jgi:hypothetical protein
MVKELTGRNLGKEKMRESRYSSSYASISNVHSEHSNLVGRGQAVNKIIASRMLN